MPTAPMRGSATGDWMVVEADESDGTFLKLPADVAIVTNIDPEHLDHFQHLRRGARRRSRQFVENIPFYGFAVMCIDHPVVQTLVGRIEDRRDHHLRRKPAGRRAPRRSSHADGHSHFSVCVSRPRRRCGPHASAIFRCRCPASTTRSTPRPPSRSPMNSEVPDERDPQGARRLRRRQAPLHPHRRMERRGHHRRLRPSSGRDRRGAQGGAGSRRRQGDRRGAAASLHAAARSVRASSAPASTTPTR